MSRLTNSIEHRKCHRRPKQTQDKYDIEMKILKLIKMKRALETSMPHQTFHRIQCTIKNQGSN